MTIITLVQFILNLLDKLGLHMIEEIERKNPEAGLFFRTWDLCQKGLWAQLPIELKSWVREETNKFGGCSLMIHWFHEFAKGAVSNRVVYLVRPTKVTSIDQLDGHWMNVSMDGSMFIDGYRNGLKAAEIGEQVQLQGRKYYVAWLGNIEEIPPSLGASYAMCNILRFVYWMKDKNIW